MFQVFLVVFFPFIIFFSLLFCFAYAQPWLDRLQTEKMESTSINISNSNSASFTLPPASSLNVSGVDDETVDIRASKQLLSISYPAYIPDLMVLQ